MKGGGDVATWVTVQKLLRRHPLCKNRHNSLPKSGGVGDVLTEESIVKSSRKPAALWHLGRCWMLAVPVGGLAKRARCNSDSPTQNLGQAKGHVEQAIAVIAVHRKKRNGDPGIRICTGCPFLEHWAPGN